MSLTPEREVAIFNAARKLPPRERGFYLDGAGAGDALLRQRIEELLQANDAAAGLLPELATNSEASAPAGSAPGPGASLRRAASPSEQPGDTIDCYKLMEKIGEGGFGVVYVAEQKEPVKRRVTRPGLQKSVGCEKAPLISMTAFIIRFGVDGLFSCFGGRIVAPGTHQCEKSGKMGGNVSRIQKDSASLTRGASWDNFVGESET